MGAIDREKLELLTIDVTNPAGNIRSFPIRRSHHRVSVRRKARLARRKLTARAKRKPGFVPGTPFTNHGRKDVAHHGHRKNHTDSRVKDDSELHQHPTS